MDAEKTVQSPLKTPGPEQPSTPPAEGEPPHMRPSLPNPELSLEWTSGLQSRAIVWLACTRDGAGKMRLQMQLPKGT